MATPRTMHATTSCPASLLGLVKNVPAKSHECWALLLAEPLVALKAPTQQPMIALLALRHLGRHAKQFCLVQMFDRCGAKTSGIARRHAPDDFGHVYEHSASLTLLSSITAEKILPSSKGRNHWAHAPYLFASPNHQPVQG